jgi:hypothetical protein
MSMNTVLMFIGDAVVRKCCTQTGTASDLIGETTPPLAPSAASINPGPDSQDHDEEGSGIEGGSLIHGLMFCLRRYCAAHKLLNTRDIAAYAQLGSAVG